MSISLNLVVLRVANLEHSKRFYEMLGLQFTTEQHGKGPVHLAAKIGEVVFELYPQGTGNTTTSTRLGFTVHSVSDVISAIKSRGAKELSSPTEGPWGIRAILIDPDGHKIEITQARQYELPPP